MTYDILLVDDEPLVRRSLCRLLDRPDWRITEAESGAAACRRIADHTFDVAIIDYRLGDMSGIEVLERLRAESPESIGVILTAHGSVGLAVEALKKGAYDFLQKEGDPQLTRHVVERAVDKARGRRELAALRSERLERANLPQVICRSPGMREVMRVVDQLASTEATVLLGGETGVGKSLVAEFIHYASGRADGPFVTINCGAIPRELIESELFGYADGAFTGASDNGKIGLIQRADGGTLFLDEISDLSVELQSRLLHVLETREFFSVGSVEPTRVDVRFIAATNVDLEARIREGRFRRDLFYRLNVAAVAIPPLRERREDIIPLAEHFVRRMNERYDKAVTDIAPAARKRLTGCPWPGNTRELRNVIERAVLFARGDTLDEEDIRAPAAGPCNGDSGENGCSISVDFASGENVLDEVTHRIVARAWEESDHNQSRAARLLGIPRTTFQTYLQRFQL